MAYTPWTVTFEIAPTFSPINLPSEGDWVSLGTPFEIGIRRGRQDDLDAFESGSSTVVLDNADESLDHLLSTSDLYDTEALPFTPGRLVAEKGIDRRVIFTGYTLDGFTPSGLRGGGTVIVELVDWLGWAEGVQAPDSPWSAWAAYCKPKVWIRGYSNQGSIGYSSDPDGIAYNQAAIYTGAGYDMVGDVNYPEIVLRSSTGIVTQSPSRSFRMGAGGTFGGLSIDPGDSIAQTGTWMAAGWFKTATVQSFTWAGSDWQVYLNGSGHVVAEVDVNGFNEVDTVTSNHADDVAHMWVLTVTSTGGSRSMRITTDLGTDSHSIGAAGNSGGGILNFRGLSFIDGYAGDFVYWDDATAVAAVIADYPNYDAGQGPASWAGPIVNMGMWSGDTIPERLARIPRMCGVDAPDFQVLTEASHAVGDYEVAGDIPESLAGMVRQMGDAYLGAAYVLRDGSVRVRDASMLNTQNVLGRSATYDLSTVEGRISDETGTTWVASISDNFNRSNNVSILGNTAWQYGHVALDGSIGVTSNQAYVSDASASEPLIYHQDLGRDVTVTCGFVSVVEGQGLVVRHSTYGNCITIAQGSGTVEVVGWVNGADTLIGDTGADDLGSTLTVTTDEDTITVQIDSGTVHTFTITDPVHMAGSGVGLAYTNIGVLPASSARWDNWSAECTRPLIRASNRSRTAPRADRVINIIDVDGSLYDQDADSIRRYQPRPKSFSNILGSTAALQGYMADILAARKDPTIEVGELELRPWGNQYLTDWVMRDLELERAVTYREALYRAGTEVLDATYRVTGETWDWSGTDWTVTLKIVPA